MNRLDTLLQLLENDPTSSFILFAIAKEYETLGNYHRALELYGELSAKDPKYTGCYQHFAKAYFKLDKKNEGMDIIEQWIEICSKNNQAHDLSELKNLKMNMLIGEED